MKPLTTLGICGLFLVSGVVIGWFGYGYFNEDKIIEVEKVVYKTKWKVKTKEITFKQAIGYIEDPLIIDHKIEGNWVKIHAYDNVKEVRKDVRFKVAESEGFKFYLGVGCALMILYTVTQR